MHYPLSVLNLIKNLTKLPGVGEKTAERYAMHILRSSQKEAEQLAADILDMKHKVRICSKCFALSETEVCHICSNPSRNNSLLCVTEQPADMVAIEKSGSFNGLYHILSGVLSPINGIGPDDIKIKELIKRIEEGKITEVVVATSTSMEGEATASYIAQCLSKYTVNITRIASGVPIGGDLKYVDQVTLKKAMETRHAI
ncbi:recombination mediator RecR [Desulfobacterium sp. N47]|uniref:Recombination protein RecR n=1 Tax=uncultured Desulfobacterium sp. TaxID=201089 RepID=E1YAA2_9BACT|nr:Recombination protein recR [uncultured Desulfobacterium sp.]